MFIQDSQLLPEYRMEDQDETIVKIRAYVFENYIDDHLKIIN